MQFLFRILKIGLPIGLFILWVGLSIAIPNIYINPDTRAITFVGQTPTSGEMFKKYVYISGAVAKPAVYEFQDGDRVMDVIDRAGGFTAEVDSEYVNSRLNLASLVEDEMHLYVPFKGQGTAQGDAKLISINNASLVELTKLPGVGEATANKIIQARPFGQIEDLLNVPGIGPAKFAAIKQEVKL